MYNWLHEIDLSLPSKIDKCVYGHALGGTRSRKTRSPIQNNNNNDDYTIIDNDSTSSSNNTNDDNNTINSNIHTPGLHNKIPAHKIFARVWVAQKSFFS